MKIFMASKPLFDVKPDTKGKAVNNSAADDNCDRLARQILMIDEHGESLIPRYLDVLKNGLPKSGTPPKRRVLVAGAGIAGLLATKLLKDAGYQVTLVEANGNRIGGRIKTFCKRPGTPAPFEDPLQYAEAGAMRIPTTHPLVNALIDMYDLPTQAFYNEDVECDDPSKVAGRTWLRANDMQVRAGEYASQDLPPAARSLGFPVPDSVQGRTAKQLLNVALAEPNQWVATDQPVPAQLEGWKRIITRYDSYSMYRFLSEAWNDPVIVQYIGTLQNISSRFFISFLHSFIDTFYINTSTAYREIVGGNAKLPYALHGELRDHIVMNARVVDITATPTGYQVRTASERQPEQVSRADQAYLADTVVLAMPFSSLRFVDIVPQLSYHKRRAIAELHYDSSTKVLLEFSERFWEWDRATWERELGTEYRGHHAIGGGSMTDGPARFSYFPSHRPAPDSRGGVVLASYTWADEANRWDSLPPNERFRLSLQGLYSIYGRGIEKYFTGHAQTQSWMENPYALGEAAVFTPGQLSELHPYIPGAEAGIHFAGEHTSLKHAWIEGAIESAIRVALEIHAADTP